MHRRGDQGDQVVAEDVALGAVLELADDAALEIVLGAGAPKDLAGRQAGQVVEVHIRLGEDDDFTRVDIAAKLAGTPGFVLGGGVPDGAAGQNSLEVRPQVALGSGFAAAMLGLIQRTGHQLNDGGIHDGNDAFEAEGKPGSVAATECWLQGLQMLKHGQKSCPAILGSRVRLAWESVFLGGAVAPRNADNGPECSRNASQTSLKPRLCVNWA